MAKTFQKVKQEGEEGKEAEEIGGIGEANTY